VERIERDRILPSHGETDTGPDVVHVDCTAQGLRSVPPVPVFQDGRIVLQQIRQNSPTFNSALIAFAEVHREDDASKNLLCPPNPYPRSIEDWPAMTRRTWLVEQRWLSEPDLAGWISNSRLNLLKGLPDHAADPAVKEALQRYLTYIGPAIERLAELEANGSPDSR
jgi:hypothetical protein